jgi:hypothetical protein
MARVQQENIESIHPPGVQLQGMEAIKKAAGNCSGSGNTSA